MKCANLCYNKHERLIGGNPMNNEDVKLLKALLHGTDNLVSRLSNASAFINEALPDVCWVGFYLVNENGDLYLGPFQGKPACINIKKGHGACGSAAMNGETLVVPDVHQFPGYISCDAAAMSEVVIPIHDDEGKVTAVLDIDSATLGRFSDEDSEEITALKNITEYILTDKA